MIKNILTSVITVLCLFFGGEAMAQEFSGIDKSPADIAYFRPERGAAPLMKVVYSRPQLKGRQVGVDLAPYGEVWRTGANEATEIRFYKDVKFGEETIAAGTYTLFTIPGASEWTVILNKDTDVWGAYSYKPEQDVARITVPAKTGDKAIEAFSMSFEGTDSGANLHMGWGNARVSVPFTAM